MNRLEGKISIVTGAASGMGAATAKLFAEQGAVVYIADIQDDAGTALANEIGDNAHYVHLDVTNSEQWEDCVNNVIAEHGKVDILVNNAGIIKFAGLLDLSIEDIRAILDVNIVGAMIGTKTVAKPMLEKKSGSIVNISSADGLSTANALSAYCASKWAIRGYTKATALELGHEGIRVNSIHPGGIDTPLANQQNVPREMFDQGFKPYPAQRAGDPMEVAYAALYLASDESGYCMGSELAVDGGMTAGHYYMHLPGAPE